MTPASPGGMPRYFGTERELFGISHPGSPMQARHAVLLCPPLGQDMARSQRLYRLLANAISARGDAALRFDYHGTGDSAGDSCGISWQRCVSDVRQAADELRYASGIDSVIAFGARLGANIALSAVESARLHGVLAWDPIMDGASHVEAMDRLQTQLLSDTTRFLRRRHDVNSRDEWIGFPLDNLLRATLQNVRLESGPSLKLLIDSMPSASYPEWLAASASITRYCHIERPVRWLDLDAQEDVILAHEVIDAVLAYLAEDSA